jgi:hypothetical protein
MATSYSLIVAPPGLGDDYWSPSRKPAHGGAECGLDRRQRASAPRIRSSASTLFAGRFNARQLYLHMINLQMQTLHLQNEWRTCNF